MTKDILKNKKSSKAVNNFTFELQRNLGITTFSNYSEHMSSAWLLEHDKFLGFGLSIYIFF